MDENYVLPRMSVCTFITRRVHERFYGLDKKGNCRLGKPDRSLDLSMMKKTAADSKVKGKKHGSTCCLLGYSTKLLNSSTHWQVLDSRTIFNLAKVSTVPCICAAAFSLLDSEKYGWII